MIDNYKFYDLYIIIGEDIVILYVMFNVGVNWFVMFFLVVKNGVYFLEIE